MTEVILAIHGGPRAKNTPYGIGQRFGEEELQELREALEQNTLFYHSGKKVKSFVKNFADMYRMEYAVACSSGTAAIHIALGAAGVTVGDEVITSPLTDQGTVIGILYQNAIPVFADLDPRSYNMDPSSIEARVTKRTKAIVVVHLAGNPCDMTAIMAIADRHELIVIEDCAQAYGAQYEGKPVGSIGHYGCFSTNDYKHISTGDGGIVTINTGSDADYEFAHAFADKNYRRIGDSVDRDLYLLAPNYRMTELQGAVGIAQLRKLPWICDRRHELGEALTEGIRSIPGLLSPVILPDAYCSYWFYMLRIDPSIIHATNHEIAAALKAEGIPCSAGYIPKLVYMQPLFQEKTAYALSHFPFELSDVSYEAGLCPEAEAILETAIKLPVSEFHTDTDIRETIAGLSKVARYYASRKEG